MRKAKQTVTVTCSELKQHPSKQPHFHSADGVRILALSGPECRAGKVQVVAVCQTVLVVARGWKVLLLNM